MNTFEFDAFAWVALAIIAGIVEVSIPHFGVIFISVGAVAAAIAAWLSFGAAVQIATFVIMLGVSLALLRPRLMKSFGAPGVPSRTESLIGHAGIVTHDIEATVGAGRVNIGGQDWAARSPTPLAAGTPVRVVGADGIVLEVTRA